MEESGRVGCDGWAKEVDYAVTEDITVAKKKFHGVFAMASLQGL